MADDLAKQLPKLIPQPNGRGALLSGGMPGHVGGGGRPPSKAREASREGYETRIPQLLAIIDDKAARPADVVAAMALLAKVGIPGQQELSGVDGGPIEHSGSPREAIERELARLAARGPAPSPS